LTGWDVKFLVVKWESKVNFEGDDDGIKEEPVKIPIYVLVIFNGNLDKGDDGILN